MPPCTIQVSDSFNMKELIERSVTRCSNIHLMSMSAVSKSLWWTSMLQKTQLIHTYSMFSPAPQKIYTTQHSFKVGIIDLCHHFSINSNVKYRHKPLVSSQVMMLDNGQKIWWSHKDRELSFVKLNQTYYHAKHLLWNFTGIPLGILDFWLIFNQWVQAKVCHKFGVPEILCSWGRDRRTYNASGHDYDWFGGIMGKC